MLNFNFDGEKYIAYAQAGIFKGGYVILPSQNNQAYQFFDEYPGVDELINLGTFNKVEDAVTACQNYFNNVSAGT